MTATAKKCCIFFISSAWLLVLRIVVSYLPLSDNGSDWLFSFMAQAVGMGVIPLVLYKFWVKEDVLTGLSIKTKVPGVVWGLVPVVAILTTFVTRGVSIVWQTGLRLVGYTHVNSVGTIYSDIGVLVMDILVTAILPAMFEELTDRGLLSSALGGVDDKVKLVLMAFFFALAHQNIVQTGYTFAAGLVFSYLLLTTKSIFPGAIVHFCNNFLSVIGSYSSQTNGLLARITDLYYEFINEFFLLALLIWIIAGVLLVSVLRRIGWIMKESSSAPTERKGPAEWYEYAFLYGAAAMMILSTAFTLLWGIWR
ncbi:MAG: CPBP family intramembrane metalloprotease [Clostridia bacterium]|nr:CPBP family intramembrane metalloprotease [Clostridia bacterium]